MVWERTRENAAKSVSVSAAPLEPRSAKIKPMGLLGAYKDPANPGWLPQSRMKSAGSSWDVSSSTNDKNCMGWYW